MSNKAQGKIKINRNKFCYRNCKLVIIYSRERLTECVAAQKGMLCWDQRKIMANWVEDEANNIPR